ncbi:MAG: Gfo/Idh/MocA family protein, partial [Pyrinomonadaceae bacterium]
LQVGSQYTSLDHFHKARKAIQDGLIGQVVWASGGFGRNSTKRGGEWNYYKIWPDANEQTVDWKAFLGSAPKRPFDTDRYFRWRKYWDYSGGIATDLFYHTLAPLLLSIGSDFPKRVISSGGTYVQKEKREVPDTFFMNVDYPSFTIQLACSVTSGLGAPLVIHGSEATIKISESSESPRNTTIEITPDKDYAEDFRKKTGSDKTSSDKLVINLEQSTDKHPHMANFLDSVRSRQDPHLPAELGYQTMAAIGMGVRSYRQNRVLFFDKQKRKVSDHPVNA